MWRMGAISWIGEPPGSILEKALVLGLGGGSRSIPRLELEKLDDPLRCRGFGPPWELWMTGYRVWAGNSLGQAGLWVSSGFGCGSKWWFSEKVKCGLSLWYQRLCC